MKKIQSLLILAVCLFSITAATAQTLEVSTYTSPLKTSYKNVDPEGTISGPTSISSSSVFSAFYFNGDPLPDGAYWAIDGVEYASAGFAGNTAGGKNILTSAFIGLGTHLVDIRYEIGGAPYLYALPLTVTVY